MFSIQNLQNKPVRQRKIILFVIVGILMIFVFGVWYSQFKETLNTENKQESELTSISELSDIYKNSVEKIGEIKEILEEIE